MTDKQWEQIALLLPPVPRSKNGRHPWAPNRPCLEGILWVLGTAAPWQGLPDQYPSPSTRWRRLQMWEEQDVWMDIWRASRSVGTRDQRKRVDWRQALADGSFAQAKKGAGSWQNQARKGHEVDGAERVDGQGVPPGVHLDSASPADVNLLDLTLATIAVPRVGAGRPRQKPERVIRIRYMTAIHCGIVFGTGVLS